MALFSTEIYYFSLNFYFLGINPPSVTIYASFELFKASVTQWGIIDV